jgi:hypothetical protein
MRVFDRSVLGDSVRFVLLAAVLAATGQPGLAKSARAAAANETLPTCSWDHPGHDPFMGDVVAAVDRYQDIPVDVRRRLQTRMAKREYDDIVSIRRDSITGRARYRGTIRDMHFGTGQVCRAVTRSSWTPQMQERGLVYCESGQCILVPTVCRNVSRIARSEVAAEHAEAPDEPVATPAGAPGAPEAIAPTGLAATDAPSMSMSTALALDDAPAFGAEPIIGDKSGAGSGPPPIYPVAPRGYAQVFGAGAPVTAFSSGTESAPALPPADSGGFPGAAPPPPLGDIAPAVPEAQTWALMLLGLPVVAVLRRRSLQVRRSNGAR